jgi:hypothetical protein
MHLKMLLLSWGLKLSNSKPCCEFSSSLHSFLKYLPPMVSWHQAQSVKCIFWVFCSKINPCFRAGEQIGVWKCHVISRHLKTTIFTSIVFGVTKEDWKEQFLPACSLFILVWWVSTTTYSEFTLHIVSLHYV